MLKGELREHILQKRDQLTIEQRLEKSQKITELVSKSKEFQDADSVLLFASYKSEVDTAELLCRALKGGKKVYFPRVEYDEAAKSEEMEFYQIMSEDDLKVGYKGIREPQAKPNMCFSLQHIYQSQKEMSNQMGRNILMLLPGAVFDLDGNRVGYGGGFYDRYLEKLEEQIAALPNTYLCKMALAFECQIVESGLIPVKAHDIPLDGIITEKKLAIFHKRR